MRPYKQPTVASKHSTEKALVSTLSNSQSDFITYCCGNKTLLFWEFQIPKIYCLYSVYGGLSAGNPLFWEQCQQWAEPIFIRQCLRNSPAFAIRSYIRCNVFSPLIVLHCMNKWIGLTSAVLEMAISHVVHSPESPYNPLGAALP